MPTRPPIRTPRLNAVGATIRRFRERAHISTRELARRTRVAASYVSKVELGQLEPKLEFCRRVGQALRLPETERRLLGALLTLHETEHRSIPPSAAALAKTQQAVRSYEETCRAVRVLQLSLIPGLLQTRGYMLSIFARLTDASQRTTAVAERLARQEILEDLGRTFQFLIADWALAPHWSSERVMEAQFNRLQALAMRPNIDIRVLPRDVHFPTDVPPLVSGFEVLDEALVIVDTLSGFTTYRQQEDIAVYVNVFSSVFPLAKAIDDHHTSLRSYGAHQTGYSGRPVERPEQ